MNIFSPKALIFTVGVLGIGAMIAVVATAAWQNHTWQRQTDEFMSAMTEPYRKDTYGGKTPEETWGMFLDALKKGDVELASKYFVVEKQGEMLKKFNTAIKTDRLGGAIKSYSGDLKEEKGNAEHQNKRYYFISVKNSAGEDEAYPVVFILNIYTEVWKVELL